MKTSDWFKKCRCLLSVTAVNCAEGQKACADGSACVPQSDVCDGVQSCADASDEEHSLCGTFSDTL